MITASTPAAVAAALVLAARRTRRYCWRRESSSDWSEKLARAADELSRARQPHWRPPRRDAKRRVGLVGRASEDRHRRCRRPLWESARREPASALDIRDAPVARHPSALRQSSSRNSRISATWTRPHFDRRHTPRARWFPPVATRRRRSPEPIRRALPSSELRRSCDKPPVATV